MIEAVRKKRKQQRQSAGAARETVIRIRDLTTRFGSLLLHDGINLDIYRGEILAIVGGSGSGKSVMLREILGLMHPTSGKIDVLGQDVVSGGEKARAILRQRSGVLFQNGALFSSLTVAENIEAPLREHTDLPRAMVKSLARIKLGMAGLAPEVADQYPDELSGGMVKRAALARALALDPEILFLDEPTAGLDPIGAARFDEMIRQYQRSLGLTVVMITHDLDSLTSIADRVAAIVDKKIIVDTLDKLRRVDHPWIQDYFAGARGRGVMAERDLQRLKEELQQLEQQMRHRKDR